MGGAQRLILADVAEGKVSLEEAFTPENIRNEKGTAEEEKGEVNSKN